MKSAKSTIADVALHAGVSTATVSRVINNSPSSENTRLVEPFFAIHAEA